MANNNLPPVPPEDKRSRKAKKRARKKERLKNQPKPMHIDSLPKENLGQILREVPVLDRLLNCEGVSRRWKSTTLELGWTDVKKLDYETVFNGTDKRSISKFLTKINDLLVALFHRIGPNLVELDLYSFTSPNLNISPDVCRWLHLLPNLIQLNIKGFKLSEIVEFLPGTLIELHSEVPYSLEILDALSVKCLYLEKICLKSSNQSAKVSVSVMNNFFGKYPILNSLHLIGDFIKREENVSLTSLGQLQWLEELHLSGVRAFDDVALTAVATGCRRLKTLTIENVLVSEGAIDKLGSLPDLMDFELKYHPILTTAASETINARWKSKKYNYLCSRWLTDDVILSEALKELKSAQKLLPASPIYATKLIERNILPFLIKSLSSTNDALKSEALGVLASIIRCSTSEQTATIVQAGAMQKLIKLIDLENSKSCEQSLSALAKIIGAGSEVRDHGIELGIVEYLLRVVEAVDENQAVSILREVSSVFAKLCFHKTSPLPLDIAKLILPTLGKLIIQNNDPKILCNTAMALSYIARPGSERIQCIIDLGVVPRIVSLLTHSNGDVQFAALNALGYLNMGTIEQTQLLLDFGVLKAMPKLISHKSDKIVQYAVWFLSNVVRFAEKQIQAVVDTGLVPVVIHLLVRGNNEIKRHAVWTLSKIAGKGRPEHAMYLLDQEVIFPFCNLLLCTTGEEEFKEALNGLFKILEKSGGRKEEVCREIIECQGLEKVKKLRNHESEEINKIANKIVDEFFTPSDTKKMTENKATRKDKKLKK